MALAKQVEQENGLVLGYHRIASLDIITNHANVIEVRSYATAGSRTKAQEAIDAGETSTIYNVSVYHEAPYDQDMTVAGAYRWLKENVEEYEGSEDA